MNRYRGRIEQGLESYIYAALRRDVEPGGNFFRLGKKEHSANRQETMTLRSYNPDDARTVRLGAAEQQQTSCWIGPRRNSMSL
ncbi:unnamed protein product [Protopolystoma xenopodis]|uniref:Uncharacterized protein n=1 Tax=Protopolystoma xenopodis TaxID=117903 RepID=A0A3S5ARM8_9PLAT|nr:unnamed protein product [Protopolystoma xenopodis]